MYFKYLFCVLAFFSVSYSGLTQTPILQTDLELKYLVKSPKTQNKDTRMLILMHGYGSDEKDLFELAKMFPENYFIIAPRAPYNVAGTLGYQWYEMKEINGQRDGDAQQLAKSRASITKFVTQVSNKYKVTPDRIYLSGFSQGAIMSYQVGLTQPEAVKGIAVLSGMIYPSLQQYIKQTPALYKLKIFIAHGTADNRIPYSKGKEAKELLENKGLKPEFHEYLSMGHTITADEIRDMNKWLLK
jgi:phospholipase/carboxylesterase